MAQSEDSMTRPGENQQTVEALTAAIEHWVREQMSPLSTPQSRTDAKIAGRAALRDLVAQADGGARAEILREIDAERDRQDAKWGGVPGTDRRDDHTYAAVLGEEFGECCQAWLERDTTALRAELVQTAAVAVAWIEELNNGGMLARLDGAR